MKEESMYNMVIVEKRGYFGLRYECEIDGIAIKNVNIVKFNMVKDEFEYIVLLNSRGKTIFEAYKYINETLKKKDFKSRELAGSALKFFFSFIELYNINNFRLLSSDDLENFKSFLQGGVLKGRKITLNIKTNRQEKTINMYLGVYRDFFKNIIAQNTIFEDCIKNSSREDNNSGVRKEDRYHCSEYENNRNDRIPVYLRLSEYTKIIQLITSKDTTYSTRELIFVKLMFEYGLRIGEVHGLTIEDFIKSGNNKKSYIVLRNRFSDKKHQKCKSLMKVLSRADYKKKKYTTKNVGYSEIFIENDLVDLIDEYLETTRSPFTISEQAYKNLKSSRADKVKNRTDLGENYYIFISKNYTPISASGWNKIIREIFLNVGLKVDKEIKENNLNHRLRHGYAMVLIRFMKYDRYKVKQLLRHKSIYSSEKYYNPTIEDNIEDSKLAVAYIRKFTENEDV